jgi:hypothetical protein
MPARGQAPKVVAHHRSPRPNYFSRGHVLFYLAVVAVIFLTVLTINYNLTRTGAEPFSDLTNIMAKPLANVNFP